MASSVNFVTIQPLILKEAFVQSLTDEFPGIAEEVLDEDYAGLIHLQVGCMARYANRLIQHGQLDILDNLFRFFHHVINKVDSMTENALFVSFLEHVDMDGESDKAKEAQKLLPAEYLPIWRDLRDWPAPKA